MSEDEADADGLHQACSYVCETERVRISVAPTFLESQSFPKLSRYVWAYHVRISNRREAPVRLMRRHWRITDAAGQTTEVSGDGVVGEQPVIGPGETYEYASGAPLETPSGMMSGRYEMQSACGSRFEVQIPAFSLDSPHDQRTLN